MGGTQWWRCRIPPFAKCATSGVPRQPFLKRGKWTQISVQRTNANLGHRLVRHDDLSKLNAEFFTMNGVISVVFFLFVTADLLLTR